MRNRDPAVAQFDKSYVSYHSRTFRCLLAYLFRYGPTCEFRMRLLKIACTIYHERGIEAMFKYLRHICDGVYFVFADDASKLNHRLDRIPKVILIDCVFTNGSTSPPCTTIVENNQALSFLYTQRRHHFARSDTTYIVPLGLASAYVRVQPRAGMRFRRV